MTRSRHILPPRRFWTQKEDEILRREYPNRPTQEIADMLGIPLNRANGRATKLGLKKTPEYVRGCLLRLSVRLHESGKTNRFPKGHVPANKGLHRPGYSIGRGRMSETLFKKGQLNGRAAQLYKPIGALSISKEGYIIRKMRKPWPGCRGAQCWKQEHRLLWERANGPVPAGHRLAFRDGDKKHVALDNLELVTFAEMMLRNTIHRKRSPEQKAATYALIALKRAITMKEKKNGKKQFERSAGASLRNAGGAQR